MIRTKALLPSAFERYESVVSVTMMMKEKGKRRARKGPKKKKGMRRGQKKLITQAWVWGQHVSGSWRYDTIYARMA